MNLPTPSASVTRALPANPDTLIQADAILRAQCGVTLRTVRTNLRRTYARATARQLAYGARWYGEAQTIARAIEAAYGLPVGVGACLIAALSPRTKWWENVRLAWQAAHLFGEGLTDSKPASVISENWARALRVWEAGFDVATSPEALQVPVWEAMIRALGEGPKVYAFAHNVHTGGTDRGVTIDVWATRAALKPAWSRGDNMADVEKALIRKGVYAALSLAYAAEAKLMGITPAEFQAAVWCAIAGYEG